MTLLDIVWNRTSFLLKENKYFTQINFWFPVAYVTVVGLFFRDKALECRALNQEQVKRREQRPYAGKLCRFPRSILFEVTLAFGKMWLLIKMFFFKVEEWLGWMQLVISAYWVTSGSDEATNRPGSNQLPLQNHIQLLVSAQLFILGYQQFNFTWKKPTPAKEFVRICQVGPSFMSFTI